jgi:seryl-tRNA synthetase
MIDPRLLRDDQLEATATALARRGFDRAAVDGLAALEARRRELVAAVDDARAEQKAASKEIGTASPEDRPAMIEQASVTKQRVADLEAQLAGAEAEFEDAVVRVPNLPHPDAPPGQEGEGVVVKTVGDRPEFDFEVRDHVDLLEPVGALDLARAAKVSGARFTYLMGEAALLELALVRYAIDVAQKCGHVPVMPPVLVRREAMFGTGFLPTDEQQIFRTDERDDLYLTGTAEVTLAGMHLDEILDEVPVRYVGFSTCFRREAGTYGKDTRGMFRVHQFDKVELFSFVAPEDSDAEHERLLAIEEDIFSGLELHYQVVDIPVGDLGASAARKFDIEAWMPGQQAFREVTSTSNTTDYQARRLACRYRTAEGSPALVHTLNGTALAVGRAIIALVETHQRADGSVAVPAALQPHLGTDVLFAR